MSMVSPLVSFVHRTPRLHGASNTFDRHDPQYLRGALLLPAVIVIIGIASVLVLLAALLVRHRVACCDTSRTLRENRAALSHTAWRSRADQAVMGLYRAYMGTALLLFTSNHVSFYAASLLHRGSRRFQAHLHETTDYVSALIRTVGSIHDSVLKIEGNIVASGPGDGLCRQCAECTEAAVAISALSKFCAALMDATDTADGYLYKLLGLLGALAADTKLYAVTYMNAIVYTAYAVGVSTAIALLVPAMLRNQRVLLVTAAVLQSIILITLGVGCVLFFLLILISDFCTNPAAVIRNETPDSVAPFVAYFADCASPDQLTRYVDVAIRFADNIQVGFSASTATKCFSNSSAALAIDPALTETRQLLVVLSQQIDCTGTSTAYHDAVEHAFCDWYFDGMFTAVVQLLAAAGLTFACTCVGAVLYYFFGEDFDEVWAAVEERAPYTSASIAHQNTDPNE